MELILGLLILICLSRITLSEYSQKSLEGKWALVLDYSSNTCQPIPIKDRIIVANLYEQSEQYCRKNNIAENNFLLEIRQNYKTTTYDF